MYNLTLGSIVQLADGRVVTNFGTDGIQICEPFTFQTIHKFPFPESYGFYYEACPFILLNDNTVFIASYFCKTIYIFDQEKFHEMVINIDQTKNYYWIYDRQKDIINVINEELKVYSKFMK